MRGRKYRGIMAALSLMGIAFLSGFQSYAIADGQILFSSNRDGDYDIYVMDTNGENLRRLTNNKFSDSAPDWSISDLQFFPQVSIPILGDI